VASQEAAAAYEVLTATGSTAAEVTASQQTLNAIIRPSITRLSDYLLADDALTTTLVNQYHSYQLQMRRNLAAGLAVEATRQLMISVSMNLGLYAAQRFAESSLGLTSAQRVCCDQFPGRGGAATGKFDLVYDTGDRIVILEAKGGKSYLNPAARAVAGRKIVI